MRNIARFAAALTVVAALVPLAATAAQAEGGCSQGDNCVWTANDYAGTKYRTSADNKSLKGLSVNNLANSAEANGGNCYFSYFFDYYGAEGDTAYDHFTLYSKTRAGSNYEDPNLSNGVGYDGAGIDWHNRVSSMSFSGC